MIARPITLILALAALSFGGCSNDPVNETHNGALEASDSQHPRDQSYYDEYTFKADEGWQINIAMNAADQNTLDPYLQLRREGVDDTEWLQENDDGPSGDKNSSISVIAPASGTYKVWANSYESGMTGAYTLTISAQPAQ